MIKCPSNMLKATKDICYQKCGCIKAQGKVCLDDTLSDCKTKSVRSTAAFFVEQHPSSDQSIISDPIDGVSVFGRHNL